MRISDWSSDVCSSDLSATCWCGGREQNGHCPPVAGDAAAATCPARTWLVPGWRAPDVCADQCHRVRQSVLGTLAASWRSRCIVQPPSRLAADHSVVLDLLRGGCLASCQDRPGDGRPHRYLCEGCAGACRAIGRASCRERGWR